MGSVTIKLLVTLAFLAIYLYFDRVNKVQVALGFFVIYIGYTIVLVKSLTTHLSGASEEK
jgi:ABC-type transport system involved in cytochrome c biogenesis permease subunit